MAPLPLGPARGPAVTGEQAALRAELRAALHELADALHAHEGRHRHLDAVRHAWILADLADTPEGPVRAGLRELARHLRARNGYDPAYHANQLTLAADRFDDP